MNAILTQLGLDHTFFVQLVIFAVLFFVLSATYFKPFFRLLEARHKKTVEDREAAERMIQQAQSKFEEYKVRLAQERASAKKEFEAVMEQAKKDEATLLSQARAEAKKITQEANDSITAQRESLKKQLEQDVEGLAQQISEKLLARK